MTHATWFATSPRNPGTWNCSMERTKHNTRRQTKKTHQKKKTYHTTINHQQLPHSHYKNSSATLSTYSPPQPAPAVSVTTHHPLLLAEPRYTLPSFQNQFTHSFSEQSGFGSPEQSSRVKTWFANYRGLQVVLVI